LHSCLAMLVSETIRRLNKVQRVLSFVAAKLMASEIVVCSVLSCTAHCEYDCFCVHWIRMNTLTILRECMMPISMFRSRDLHWHAENTVIYSSIIFTAFQNTSCVSFYSQLNSLIDVVSRLGLQSVVAVWEKSVCRMLQFKHMRSRSRKATQNWYMNCEQKHHIRARF